MQALSRSFARRWRESTVEDGVQNPLIIDPEDAETAAEVTPTPRKSTPFLVYVALIDLLTSTLLWLASPGGRSKAWSIGGERASSLPATLVLLAAGRCFVLLVAGRVGYRLGIFVVLAAAASVLGVTGERAANHAPTVVVASYACAVVLSACAAASLEVMRNHRQRPAKSGLDEPLLPDAEKSNAAGFLRILNQSKPEWPAMAGATVALLLAVMSQSVMPVLFGRMIDAMDKGDTRAERTKAYTKACLELAIVVGGGLVFTAIRAYIFNSSGVRVVARLRVLLFRAMLAQETAWFDASETGDLLSRLASDTAKLQAAATETVSLLMRNLVLTLVSLVLLFTTSWRLTLLALGIVPCLCGVTFAAIRVVKKLSTAVQTALGRAGAVAQEGLANVRVVRSFGAEEWEATRYAYVVGNPDERKYKPAPESSLALGLRQAFVQAGFITSTAGLGYTSVLIVWYYGGLLVVRDEMTKGDLVAFVMLLLTIVAALSVLAQTGASVVEAIGASVELFKIIDRKPRIPNTWAAKDDDALALENSVCRTDAAASCEFRDVVFAYEARPDLRVLDGASLVVPGCVESFL